MAYRYNPFTGDFDIVNDDIPSTFANEFDADSGSAVPANNLLNVLGDSAQGITSTGSGNTITYTIADATTSQKGVLETSTDAESINGTANNVAVTPESLKAKLGSQTVYGAPYGNGDTNIIEWTAGGSDGQILIAATSSAPQYASLTSTGGTITFTPGPNSLNLEASTTVAITFDANSGSATPVANVIEILGTSAQGITTSATSNTVTITASDATTSQKGVLETSTDAETISGTATTVAVTPESLKAKLGSQTADGIPYGAGDTAAIGWTSGLTDGQLVIGSTAGTPAAASLASADSSITITPGANSIDLATGSAVAASFTTDSGTATPSSGVIDIAGGTLLNTAGATNVVTINADDNVVGSVGTDSGSVTPASNTFNIVGSTGISTSGATDTVTLTLSGDVAQSFPTDSGTATPSSGALTVAGGTLLNTSGSGATVTVNADSSIAASVSTDSGTATPSSNSFSIVGAGTVSTSASGSTVTITGSGGVSWTEVTVTGPTAMSADNGYVANNASTVALTLPTSADLGSVIKVDGKGSGGWEIQQNAGQTIHFLSSDTTTGTGGSLASTQQYNCVTLRCITANTDFVVESATGNLTVT